MRREYINYPFELPIKISYLNIKNYPTHWHNSIEIIYVLKGSLQIKIDTDSFILNEREVEIINSDESHEIQSLEDNKVLIFNIDPFFFEKYYKDINNIFFYTNSNDTEDQNGSEYEELKTLLSQMLCEYVQKLEDYDEEIEELLITLLYHLVNNFHYLTYEKEELKEKTDQLARYHRISKYIYNNYNNNITLQEIAKKEFLSTHYLSHEIKYATGYSFTDLINLTRIEESIKLLLDSDMSISEISDEIGFSHVRYFNKNFKYYFGCTPLQYRKKYATTEKEYELSKQFVELSLNDALETLSYNLENYNRFNFENKLWNIHVNVDKILNPLEKEFKECINLGESFDLLIEDNKDILEEIQEEIHFEYGRLEKMFHSDMGVFLDSDFYNWNKAKGVLEFLSNIYLKPLILLDNLDYSLEKYINILSSFLDYFTELDIVEVADFKFQFNSRLSEDIKYNLRQYIKNYYQLEVCEIDFTSKSDLNSIYDTAYMLPYIIHNTIFKGNSLSFLKAFDVLEKEINITNEVFIGAPGIVNDMGIRKPSYYAYYLLSKLGNDIIALDDGYIVTKSDNYYAILLYSHNDDVNNLASYEDIYQKGGIKKSFERKYSLNIVNIKNSTRIITYELNESLGSSYNYWLAMGSPDRLSKEEKEILHKASYPKIEFKYSKKSSVLNIITELKGYGAKLIVLKNIK
ncbi:helix-turn-helix domain-containing protein [uncultured Clostridium sp.]|uniref:AraC family transcriptional regulator n=1 Tax=uncultured Clostridium sp. TaxID=59620 RepID=UPI0025E091D4|nr:helix-turn-helix domain-containing protein [uncultured Clostridium sp.]MDU4884419.1 helix-turn-helix domain-containing protein [Clostridium celatum]MDU7077617.1 helix-turn-helix domain-containing protein [Clostridium celatum]